MALAGVVLQQHRRGAVVADEHVHTAVVVVVADGQPARRKGLRKHRPRRRTDVLQLALTVVLEHQQRLLVFHLLAVLLDHVVGVAVGEEQIHVAVVVEVEELQAPARQQARRLRDAVRGGDVGEELVAVVAVEREHLLVDVGHEQVLPAVLVEVGRIDAHPRARRAVGAEPHLGGQPDLFPLALAAVGEEEVLDGVVGDEQVDEAVVVDVGGHHAQRLAHGAGDVGAGGDVGEGAVAVVVEDRARRGPEHPRDAVEALAELVVAAEHVVLQVELDKRAEEQVEAAVVVVVEPHGAGGPVRRLVQAGLLRDVGKGPVAVVAIENRAAVGGDEDVRSSRRCRSRRSAQPIPKVWPVMPAFSVTSVNEPSRLFLYRACFSGVFGV